MACCHYVISHLFSIESLINFSDQEKDNNLDDFLSWTKQRPLLLILQMFP